LAQAILSLMVSLLHALLCLLDTVKFLVQDYYVEFCGPCRMCMWSTKLNSP